MLRRVALVRTAFSEDLSASFIRVRRIGYCWRCSYLTDSCHPDVGGATFLAVAVAVAVWLRRYVTNLKVAGSRPDEVNDFYQVT
jgi:hypothetical protein